MISKNVALIALITGLFLFGFSPQSQAVLVLDLQYTNNNETVGPTDTVLPLARLFNNSTEGETVGEYMDGIDYGIIGYSSGGGNANGYSFGGMDFSQFTGLILNPGETFDFSFVPLTPFPPGSQVPEGDYFTTESLRLQKYREQEYPQIGREFSWTVSGGPGDQTVIPEPTTLLLFGGGLLGAYALRRKR